MCTPQSDGKRERLCFIEHKDKSFVSNHRDFRRENILIFRSREGRNKNTGTFSRSAPCFSHRSPSFSGRLPAMGGKIGSCFLAPLGVRSVSGPSAGAPSRMTHARGDAHPRLAHSASFHFFAFTPHLQSIEQLLVRGEGFVFP